MRQSPWQSWLGRFEESRTGSRPPHPIPLPRERGFWKKEVASRPHHPAPLPKWRGNESATADYSLSPWGEGWGEAVLGRISLALSISLALFALTALSVQPALAASEGSHGVSPFLFEFSIFVLAIFVGYYVVWSVTPALHTPLMSVTNAISSVIVVGALLAVAVEAADGLSASGSTLAKLFGFLALVMASINIFGGFLVTSRMLAMYKKKEKKVERP
jgi:H+-translocating NAD(P) transhydrogenase subunit alpha